MALDAAQRRDRCASAGVRYEHREACARARARTPAHTAGTALAHRDHAALGLELGAHEMAAAEVVRRRELVDQARIEGPEMRARPSRGPAPGETLRGWTGARALGRQGVRGHDQREVQA
jgi:hypothetical protein